MPSRTPRVSQSTHGKSPLGPVMRGKGVESSSVSLYAGLKAAGGSGLARKVTRTTALTVAFSPGLTNVSANEVEGVVGGPDPAPQACIVTVAIAKAAASASRSWTGVPRRSPKAFKPVLAVIFALPFSMPIRVESGGNRRMGGSRGPVRGPQTVTATAPNRR